MSAVLAHTIRDDAGKLIRQHGGDADAQPVDCLREIDRLGLLLEAATYADSYGYTHGRIRNPTPVKMAAGGIVKALDIKN